MRSAVSRSQAVAEESAVALSDARPVESVSRARVRIDGRLFRLGETAWYVKGFTYGPFRPNRLSYFLPDRKQTVADLAQMQALGCNAVRLYHPPSPQFLDDALAHDIRVMIDVPWE